MPGSIRQMSRVPAAHFRAIGFGRDCLANARDGAMGRQTCGFPRLARHPEMRPSRSPISIETLYATLETRVRPGRLSVIGGTRRVGGGLVAYARIP
jgi:hypothetical protein